MTKTQIKKALIFAGICVALIAALKEGNRYLTKRFSPEAHAVFESTELTLVVDYCQPSTKGRDIFGIEEALVPYGEVWRTGANEATEVTIDRDVLVNNQPLNAGTYTLFTIPQPSGWTIIFNKKLGQWGAFDYDESLDVLRVDVPSQETDQVHEIFTIGFDEDDTAVNMELQWDNTLVRVPFQPQS